MLGSAEILSTLCILPCFCRSQMQFYHRFTSRFYFKLLTMTFKCLHYLAPTPLAVKVHLSSPIDMLLDTSWFYSTSGERDFSCSAPCCWNALPRSLCVIPCLETFKAHLKHHLFTNYSTYLHAVNPCT